MKVLYATDGSSAAPAQDLMSSLFDRACDIHAVTIASVTAESGWLSLPDAEKRRTDTRMLLAEHVARSAADELSLDGFRTSWEAKRGSVSHGIVQELSAGAYDLVVMGGQHTTRTGNAMLGTVSMRVLHHSPTPVLIAHRAPGSRRKVVVATDGSDSARSSMRFAEGVLDASRCSIEVVNVVPNQWVSIGAYPPAMLGAAAIDHRELDEGRVEWAWDLVDKEVSHWTHAGFSASGSVLMGHSGHQLSTEAERLGAAMVVVGSRGLGPLGRTVLGSVSDHVVRHAPATLVGRAHHVVMQSTGPELDQALPA